MPQHVVLSNGAKLDIPDGTPSDEISSRVRTANALIAAHVPSYIGGGKMIYDALHGGANVAARVAGAGVDLIPGVGAADWGIGGLNAAKSVAAANHPALNNVPDLPTASGIATAVMGPDPLPPDASPLRRYGEAALTGALSPGSTVMNTLRMLTGTLGGDAGVHGGGALHRA